MKTIIKLAALPLLLVAACDGARETGQETASERAARAAAVATTNAELVVYKSPTCGCCSGWIDHMQAAGFAVEAVDLVQYADLAAAQRQAGVPADLGSCHTAVIEGYTIEGHVPAHVIERLLRERPDIKGLSVPGMPIGSPGMEGPNPEAYDVIAFTEGGERRVYERISP